MSREWRHYPSPPWERAHTRHLQKPGTKNTLDKFSFYARLYCWTLRRGLSCLAECRPLP